MKDQNPADNLENEDPEIEKSKSQIKREMTALQDLGVALVKLSDKELARIPMPERLADQVALARNIKSHSGLRRQLQFIGKLMRQVDVEPIQVAYNEVINGQQQDKRLFHQLENLRQQLIDEGDQALSLVLEKHPQADRQHLRQLIRLAQKEQQSKTAAKPQHKGAGKKLFGYLRELYGE